MPQSINVSQLDQYLGMISGGSVDQVRSVYDALYGAGYMYAGWARGVASGDTITGQSALSYLTDTAVMGLGIDVCRNLTQEQIDKIRVEMARAYLRKLQEIADANGGNVERDVSYQETRNFHEQVFSQNGLSISNWTLDTPMELIRETKGNQAVDLVWQRLRDTGGAFPSAEIQSTWLANIVGRYAFSQDPNIAYRAQEWLDRVPGPANASSVWSGLKMAVGTLVNSLFAAAVDWLWPKDPLVLDLDGGGISTRGIDPSSPILFDQDGDGIKTATGWIGAGEAIVVRDLNGSGTIDSGRELFGGKRGQARIYEFKARTH